MSDLDLFTALAGGGLNVWDAAKSNALNVISGSLQNVLTRGAGPGSWTSALALDPSYDFSVVASFSTNTNVGFGNALASNASYAGSTANSVGLSGIDGNVYQGASLLGNAGFTLASGDACRTQVDIATNRVRFSKNGGAFGSYVTFASMGSFLLPMCGQYNAGDVATATFL